MSFRVVVTKESDAWLADVPECQGSHTYSPYGLAKLDTYVREVVALADDLPDGAEDGLELAWVLDVPTRDLVREFGKGWTIADVAAALNAPVERVTHTPPGLATRFRRWVTLMRLTWRYRRRFRSPRDEGDDEVYPAGGHVGVS